MAETYADAQAERDVIRRRIVEAVVNVIGEPPDEVALVAPHTVLKTSSGKLRRAATRELYERGAHRRAPRAQWRALVGASVGALGPMVKRVLRRTLDALYGAWFWLMFLFIAACAYALVRSPLSRTARWGIAHRAARAFIALAGVRMTIEGAPGNLERPRQIIVANHASYLDGVLLVAALRTPCRFVVKRELERTPFVGAALHRLDAEFVERFDARASVEAARRLAAIAGQGAPCIFFPEGTFRRAPGLLPFHLGAFTAAVASASAVIPVALRGARGLLEDGRWLPRRTNVVVSIGEPLAAAPEMDAFRASVQLRDAARAFIQTHSGEPDLVSDAT
jgi:1-acyl-sn-glycerol-3-phosphate acyltransferase